MSSAGRIRLDGEDLAGLPPYRRPVNMMFQSYALFPHMTVADNIAFGLKQDGLPREERRRRVEEMLALVKMESMAKRKPHQLSGGQQQRVALARSLAKRPKLLLLDEPMGALDKKLRSEMQLEVVNIIEQLGVTCVMVTHDQEEAMTMAHRIAIMDHGKIRPGRNARTRSTSSRQSLHRGVRRLGQPGRGPHRGGRAGPHHHPRGRPAGAHLRRPWPYRL
jgi:putrescine transport system ATP-binding protein